MSLLALVAVAYVAGVRRYACGAPSWPRGAARLGPARTAAFLAGLALAAVAFTAPVQEAGETRLWAHTGQHVILMVGAAPLLAAGAPAVPLLLLLPAPARRGIARWRWRLRNAPGTRLLYRPVTAWALGVVTLGFWHMPATADLALRSEVLHDLEHLSLLITAWGFWWHVLRAGRRRTSGGAAVLYLVGATLPAAVLGAVLTFAPAPLYPGPAAAAARTGLDPLVDQQVAGLVMWVPPDVVYLVVSVALFLGRLCPPAEREQPAAPTVAPRRPVPGRLEGAR